MVKDFIALDVETANADFASICSIGLVHFKDGNIFNSLNILIDPEDEFDPVNIAIHGIRPEQIAGKPNMARALPVIGSALRDAVIVHHSPFDRTALGRAASKYGTGGLPCYWLDTLQVARRTWGHFADGDGYGLSSLTKAFGIEFQHHNAAEDARAAGLIMLRAIADGGVALHEWVDSIGFESTETSAPYRRTVPGYAKQKHAFAGDADGPMFGETILFTGNMAIARAEAARRAAAAGCQVVDSISRKVTILVVGDQDLRLTKGNPKSTKHRKAEEMIANGGAIRIVGETDFMLMVSSSPETELEAPTRAVPPKRGANVVLEVDAPFSLNPELRHIETVVETVNSLKRDGKLSEALQILEAELDKQEAEIPRWSSVAPWYYEQAAIIYRKLGDLEAEIAVLERFAAQPHAPGATPPQLLQRLEKAKARRR